jgi:hypothetical protein
VNRVSVSPDGSPDIEPFGFIRASKSVIRCQSN